MKRAGQIGVYITFVGLLFTASLGVAWKAFDTAQVATAQISSVREDVATIKNDVSWIKDALKNGKIQIVTSTTTKK